MVDQFIYRSAGKSGPQGLPDDRSARLSAHRSGMESRGAFSVATSPIHWEPRLARAGFGNDPAERAQIKV